MCETYFIKSDYYDAEEEKIMLKIKNILIEYSEEGKMNSFIKNNLCRPKLEKLVGLFNDQMENLYASIESLESYFWMVHYNIKTMQESIFSILEMATYKIDDNLLNKTLQKTIILSRQVQELKNTIKDQKDQIEKLTSFFQQISVSFDSIIVDEQVELPQIKRDESEDLLKKLASGK